MADLGERVTRDLTIRYIAVLAVLGFVALVSFVGLTRVIGELDGSGERINVAGRQRMLVERVAFAANRLALAGPGRHDETARMLVAGLDQLEESHVRLLFDRLPADVVPIFFDAPWRLDADMRAFIAHGRDLVRRRPPIAAIDIDLLAISAAASQPLLDRLDEVTIRLQRHAQTMTDRLMLLQAVSLAVGLGTLILSAFGVFRPMVRRLRQDISERFRSAQDLRESEERLWRILEESPMGVSASRRSDGKVVFANTRFTEILGMPREEFIGSIARDHYVDKAQREAVLNSLRRDGLIDDAEVEFRRRNGEAFWSLLTIRSTHFQREPVNLAWIYDITERKLAEQQILLAAKVLENVSEGVVITDSQNKIIFVNPAFSNITEYSRDDVLGSNPKFLSSGRHDQDFYNAMWAKLRRTGNWSGEVWNRRKSGEFFAEWLSITMIRDAVGAVTHYVAVFTDITHRKEDEARVWRQANYDALTGLPNRSLFLDRLAQAVRQARREAKGFALMFLDLDGFKQVNDTLGHAAGDVLLQQTAVRLSECMRGSDTLARLAGDEFVVILQGVRGRQDPTIVAGKILEQLSRPYPLDGGDAQIQGSIGIAIFPDDSESGEGLLKLADEAMYAVKRQGKNGFRFAGEIRPSSDQSS
ncbi:diguanylate cyclase [Magnetospirillum sp. SS-4]|uniref:diguanylate cyclase domain-containing protein n=1 Tax=Magnetospirillum sp. SS-4 TaxID=2681465 RepID=UPI0013849C97|nr:diguanylate cyclase [Magnetospirillum sp. SS-4]CAA7620282.1 PAS/PAC domain-containing protein [Magnetospirillum sp. SS-4]